MLTNGDVFLVFLHSLYSLFLFVSVRGNPEGTDEVKMESGRTGALLMSDPFTLSGRDYRATCKEKRKAKTYYYYDGSDDGHEDDDMVLTTLVITMW